MKLKRLEFSELQSFIILFLRDWNKSLASLTLATKMPLTQ